MSINVSNPSSDRLSKINNASAIIGRSKDTLEFFNAVYTKKTRIKTISDILNITSIKSVVRVLQVAKKLASNDIVEEIKDPKTKRKAWKKIDFYTHNKKEILRKVKENSRNNKTQSKSIKDNLKTKHKNKNLQKKWDVFISHAYQDKKIADPFVNKLKKSDIKVWYDRDILKWGDSLMDSINKGLKNSIFGIVILSKTFFKKKWTLTELRALLSLANRTGEKKILPLFYKITHDEITEKYPILADIVGRSWDDGLENLVQEIKELVNEKRKRK